MKLISNLIKFVKNQKNSIISKGSEGIPLKMSLDSDFDAKTFNPNAPATDHLGNNFETVKSMCGYWNINLLTFFDRKQKGWSLKECLCGRKVIDPNTKDTNGNKPNVQRINASMDDLCVTDHLGNRFDNIDDMCNYWGKSRTSFDFRRNLGWSLRDCLEAV